MEVLINHLFKLGARREHLEAKVFGGGRVVASMTSSDVGARNARFVREYLDTFVAAGLQGLEAHRPRVSSADRRALKKLAKRNGLVLTGGSDWHGWNGHQLGLFHVTRYDLTDFLALLTEG